MDQDLTNWLLLTDQVRNPPRWGLLPSRLVTGEPSLTNTTEVVAYHTIGLTGAAKYASLDRVWGRHRRLIGEAAGSSCSSGERKRVAVPREWLRLGSMPETLECP